MRSFLWTFILATSLSAFGGDASSVLKTVEELEDFIGRTGRELRSFAVTGLVTSAHIFQSETNRHDFILKGAEKRVYVYNSTVPPPAAGTVVRACGITSFSSDREHWMGCNEIAVLGHGSVEDALRLPLAELDMTGSALREVVVEATVAGVLPDEVDPTFSFLILKDGVATLPVACRGLRQPRHLEDAHIRVKGVLLRNPGGQRKHLGFCLAVRDIGDIAVVTPPPDDPFDFPPLPPRLYLSPQEVADLGKRSVSGHVIAVWRGNRLYVVAADGQVIGVELSDGEVPPAYGAAVTVVGHPETDLYRINLTGARIRTDGGAALADRDPEETTPDVLLAGDSGKADYSDKIRGRLVRLRGIVRSLPTAEDADKRLLLDCGRHKLPVDYGANPTAADGVTIGCTVEVTGRCLLETEKWTPTRIFPRINGLTLVLRRPDDLRVLSRPSWWTTQRLTVVIAGLFTTLLGLFVWNRFLNRLIRRKSRALMKEEIAHLASELKIGERTRLAVELHDSISQTLAGVTCQIAAGRDAVAEDPKTATALLDAAERMLESSRNELKNCLFDLRNNTVDDPDFARAIARTLSIFTDESAFSIRFSVSRARLTDSAAHAVLCMIRELVANAIRHGKAAHVRVAGAIDGKTLSFSVTDDGTGFDPQNRPGPREGHFGLAGIGERLSLLGGTMSVESSPGHTRIAITLPL